MSFKNKAKDYDNESRIKRSKIVAKKIIDITINYKNSSIMEYGCATGLIGFNLQNKFRKITLIDSEEEMIKVVKKKIESNNIKNVFPINLNLMNENYNGEKFDVIYTSLTLHHILDVKSIIEKFYNLLNENGILIIFELDEDDGLFHMDSKNFRGHNGFKHQYLEDILSSVDFKNIESKTFFNSTKIVNNLRIPYSIFYIVGYKKS